MLGYYTKSCHIIWIPIHNIVSYFFMIHINIDLPSASRTPKCSIFPTTDVHPKPLCTWQNVHLKMNIHFELTQGLDQRWRPKFGLRGSQLTGGMAAGRWKQYCKENLLQLKFLYSEFNVRPTLALNPIRIQRLQVRGMTLYAVHDVNIEVALQMCKDGVLRSERNHEKVQQNK
jgi:hypothetical protein